MSTAMMGGICTRLINSSRIIRLQLSMVAAQNQARRNALVALRYILICGSAHLHVRKVKMRLDGYKEKYSL
jgi:hypothetical protein